VAERWPTNILLAGNIRIYCEGIRLYVEQFDDINIAGIVSDASEMLANCRKREVDVLLVDARLPGVLEILPTVREVAPRLRVVVLAASMCREQLARFIEAGNITEFITENDSLEELRCAIDSSLQYRFSCSPKLARLLMGLPAASALRSETPMPDELQLTRRQIRVLELIESGKSNKEIARSLNIATNTVKNHVHAVLRRMNASTRCEAAAKYRRITSHQ
jgi:DNA-binding NarL/FixJ family response regulator